jgi:hypothetical protein
MVRRKVFLTAALVALAFLVAAGALYARPPRSTGADKPTMKVIVLVKAKGNASEVVTRLQGQGAKSVYKYHLVKGVSATISRKTWNDLRKDGNVGRVVPDLKMFYPEPPVVGEEHPFSGTGSNVLQDVLEPEALQLTHAEDAWKITVDGQPVMGQGVRVGMVDTGTDPSHPDLAGAIQAYRDFTGTGLRDNDGHGTGTSSMVVGQGLPVFNRETHTSMKLSGMAPEARVLMAKVGDVNGGWDSQFIRGIEWLVDQKVDIISDSWGGFALPPDGRDPVSAMAVQAAIDQGITFCVSAFNEGPGQGTLGSPSDLKDALTVGATTGAREFSQIGYLASPGKYLGDQVIDWSSRGPTALGDYKPDVMAFGAFGWALAPTFNTSASGRDIQEFGGTSMAAPVCAGDLALAESAWKLAHPGQLLPAPSYWKALLASTATDIGYPGLEGSTGLVNAEAAVKAVLGEGKSFLATVADDPKNPSSWSVKAAGGATVSTTITVANTGDAAEHITLAPTMFAADESQTITRDLTLTSATGYAYTENVTVPEGTDLVDVRCTWPSGPFVSLRTAVYDSAGDFLVYGPTYGGYGHLSLSQVSLTGPAGQRPVVEPGKPWQVVVFPRGGMAPTGPQAAHLRIEFLHKADWPAVSLSTAAFDLEPGDSEHVTATLTTPSEAGTRFGKIVVSNGAAATSIPVAIRVPVDVTGGAGTFSGALTGSTVEYNGGEFSFFDFTVPPGTASLAASLTWPHEGNLIDLYLVDPAGNVRVAKGGDLNIYPDYSSFLVPPEAFAHTAEQVVWDRPMPGTWQALVWGGGFYGGGFDEPFTGHIVLDRTVVSPATWDVTVAPGGSASTTFTVANDGVTAVAAYADSQSTAGGTVQYATYDLGGFTGQLTPTKNGFTTAYTFPLPEAAVSASVNVTWMSPGSLIDLGLYDPTGTDKAESLADSALGNSAAVADPMAGLWTVTLGFADPTLPAMPAKYVGTASYVAPIPLAGLVTSAPVTAPLRVEPGTSATITATFTAPATAKSGDVITGMLTFYSSGGDHLGMVPVTATIE